MGRASWRDVRSEPNVADGQHRIDEAQLHIGQSDLNQRLISSLLLAALVSILIAGAIGISLRIMGKTMLALRPDREFFFLVRASAGGVILATRFIHVLPDTFENLTSPCLDDHPWSSPCRCASLGCLGRSAHHPVGHHLIGVPPHVTSTGHHLIGP
ncbi:Zinc transporter 1 [Acorus calamus]|uniref:Zinc transporter 1 n=1 Tax=Acorus calamus TaxID=4465 RepID=A0AAV9EAI8_ACOCL|nr:Zinc transporter 1 [Acorus calamus]